MNQSDLDCQIRIHASDAACRPLDCLGFVYWSNVHEIPLSRVANPWNDGEIHDDDLVHISSLQLYLRVQRMRWCIVRIVVPCELTFSRTPLNGSRCRHAFHSNAL